METHWAHLDGETWSTCYCVTGEAALAGQGAERLLGEPSSRTKETEHVALNVFIFLHFLKILHWLYLSLRFLLCYFYLGRIA